jgi:hypothetical protein
MRSLSVYGSTAVVVLVAAAACSAGSNAPPLGGGPSAGTGGDLEAGPAGNSGAGLGGSAGSSIIVDLDSSSSETGPSPVCEFTDAIDHDGDGYSYNDGDCNDCDPFTNPGALDDGSPSADGGPPVDVNCDGVPGGDTYECDDGIQIDDSDALNGARAIGLCRKADPNATGKDKTWGVLSAKYVKADGQDGMNPDSHGILPQFGAANVQQGAKMLALSSGTARAPGDVDWKSPGGVNMGTECDAPISNMDTPACHGVTTGSPYDPAALELQIRMPTNAKSFKFHLNFYTYEFPDYICSEYNDFFVTLMEPKPSGSTDGNISFDPDHNPISVNNSMLQVCQSMTTHGKTFDCPLGTALLKNTGFDSEIPILDPGHAATGWLQTISSVEPGSVVTLRFAIWDSGDHKLDSLVLIDNFGFSVEPASGASTKPAPTPK